MTVDQPTTPRRSPEVKQLFARLSGLEGSEIVPDWLNELKPYLPPDLWRKLSEDNSRKGFLNNALDRMQSLHYVISTYLPADLVQEKVKDPRVESGGKMTGGCLLFSDVSGFTALSEKLADKGPKGAEALTDIINRYFTEMIDILSRSNGILLKFAGDATLVFFPEQPDGEHVQWAARAGLRMMRAMKKFTDLRVPLLDQPVTITMKIGLSAGKFLTASVGSEKRMEFALVGATVSQTLQAEGCTNPGQIVTNQAAADLLRAAYEMTEVKPGFYLLNPTADEKLDEYEITQTRRIRARGSAVQWGATPEEIRADIKTKLTQIKALTPYLASELVDRIIAHADQRQVRSEYRPTIVMFCNFTGPGSLLDAWGEAGAKRVTKILSDYFTAIDEVISRFGGIVSRIDPYSQGTKLLALFGAPVAHEDDAQRAISAALEMNNALARLNQEWRRDFSRHLPAGKTTFIQHRIGITLGDTFAGQAGSSTRREYTVMGDEVNLAARLMSTARIGQILISQPVFEVTDAYYVTRKLPSVRVKGKKNPIEIWQVDGPREDTLLNRIQNRPPLIGRTSELELGWQVFQRAHSGKDCVLTLTGQAGIGKSHLADVLIKKAQEDGWHVHAFQCRSYLVGEPYACWKGILRSLAGITAIDHLLTQKEKVEILAAEFSLPAGQSNALIEIMKLGEARSELEITQESGKFNVDDLLASVKKKELTRKGKRSRELNKLVEGGGGDQIPDEKNTRQWNLALAAILSKSSAKNPLVIFFEDAQWMDAESKNLLKTMSREISARGLLFLLAHRTQDAEWEKIGRSIELVPFTMDETRSMIAEILTAGLVDIIHNQSGGSPLFVEEISRWIKREHKIDEKRLKDILQNSDILQRLVLSRVESLPEGQREVARLASVIGMEFRSSEVKALMEIDAATLHEYLTALENAGLIAVNEYLVVDNRYTFLQPIFRDVLYTSLPFERRSELHSQMAKHLAQSAGGSRKQKISLLFEGGRSSNPLLDAEKLAYHYEMSEQWLEAAKQIIDAAENIDQPQEKIEALYARALALLETYPPEKTEPAIGREKVRAHLALGNAALKRLDLAAAAASHESALAALPAESTPEAFASLTARLCLFLPGQGKAETAEKLLPKALEEKPNDWKLLATSAWIEWRARRNPLSHVEACRASLPAAESESVLRVRAWMNDLVGDFEQAAKTYQLLNEMNAAAVAWVQWGDRLLNQKNPDKAIECYEQAAAIWQDVDFCGMALIRYREAEAELQARRKSRALALLKEALSLLEKSAPILQTEPRNAIQKSMTRINAKNYGEWQYWRWQPFDDLIRIQFCLPLFQEVQ